MRRRSVLAASLAAVACLVCGVGAVSADTPPPFYLIPSPTKECQNLSHCLAVTGPWVLVPAHGEATFLVKCPEPTGFVVGGTDARASSSHVRIWFEGQLGTPIGTPTRQTKTGAALLFHAVSGNGKAASFEPIIGCVILKEKSKRSTVSARVSPSAPPDYRTLLLPLNPELHLQNALMNCYPGERLIGTWTAVTYPAITTTPPIPPPPGTVKITTTTTNVRVVAVVRTRNALFTAGVFPVVQVGAVCEP